MRSITKFKCIRLVWVYSNLWNEQLKEREKQKQIKMCGVKSLVSFFFITLGTLNWTLTTSVSGSIAWEILATLSILSKVIYVSCWQNSSVNINFNKNRSLTKWWTQTCVFHSVGIKTRRQKKTFSSVVKFISFFCYPSFRLIFIDFIAGLLLVYCCSIPELDLNNLIVSLCHFLRKLYYKLSSAHVRLLLNTCSYAFVYVCTT